MKKYSAPAQKLLGVGNALLDTLIRLPDDRILPELELAKGCMTLIDEAQCRRIVDRTAPLPRTEAMGGSAANTVRGIAALKLPCGYIGKVGDDEAGRLFRRDIESLGISSRLLSGSLPTGRCFSLISPDGERTMATYLGSASNLLAADFSADMFPDYRYLHIEGYLVQNQTMIERALELAKEAGVCIVLDLSSPNVVTANLQFFRDLANTYVDIILANEEEAMAFSSCDSPREALQVLSSYCKIAVVKLGAKGSLIAYQHTRYLIPIYPAVCIDTTGAGDLYAAGFLYGMARGLGLETCGKIGALLAARVIEVVGAAIPATAWPAIRAQVRKLEA